ncbi:MAG TPA: acyl carrier protein [Microthrixaceae bacterium]|nr:acyl carrier protein [Microthrixaceae bacterium]HNI36349.1 acyl carrier protein [Microthrixaceae bacterium]
MSNNTDSAHTELIRSVLADHGRLGDAAASLGENDSLYEAGLTSHASVNVMLAIEDELDVEFPEHLLRRSTFETIANLCAAVDELVQVGA